MNPIYDLVAHTVRRHIRPEAAIVSCTPTAMQAGEQGYSGAQVVRQVVTFRTSPGSLETTTLITKHAPLVERRVLDLLQEQGQSVPFSHTLDLATDAPALICQQDVQPPGADVVLPTDLHQQVARCLARIHLANRGKAVELAWLPRADYAYFVDSILADFREQLAQAMQQPAFLSQCGDVARQMEHAIEPFLTSMAALWAEAETHTLIHADMMDTHVLVQADRPYLIDWGQARYGSFYLDLPNYFTPGSVGFYREALAELGAVIPAAEFMQRYRAAGRYPGFKYMGFLLHLWAAGQLNSLQGPLLHYLLHGAGDPAPA